MNYRKLSFIIAFSLCSTPIVTSCGQTPTPETTPTTHKEQPQKTQDEKKPTPQAIESELIPTDDPNVFKTSKILPRPAEATNYPKPEYPKLGYENSFEGAEKVAIYLEELIVYSFSTGDYEDLKAVCTNASSWCTKVIGLIEKNNKTKSWRLYIEKPVVEVTGYGIPPKDNNKGEVSIRLNTTLGKRELFNAEKLTKTVQNKTLLRRYVNLRYLSGRWVIVSLDSEEIK